MTELGIWQAVAVVAVLAFAGACVVIRKLAADLADARRAAEKEGPAP